MTTIIKAILLWINTQIIKATNAIKRAIIAYEAEQQRLRWKYGEIQDRSIIIDQLLNDLKKNRK